MDGGRVAAAKDTVQGTQFTVSRGKVFAGACSPSVKRASVHAARCTAAREHISARAACLSSPRGPERRVRAQNPFWVKETFAGTITDKSAWLLLAVVCGVRARLLDSSAPTARRPTTTSQPTMMATIAKACLALLLAAHVVTGNTDQNCAMYKTMETNGCFKGNDLCDSTTNCSVMKKTVMDKCKITATVEALKKSVSAVQCPIVCIKKELAEKSTCLMKDFKDDKNSFDQSTCCSKGLTCQKYKSDKSKIAHICVNSIVALKYAAKLTTKTKVELKSSIETASKVEVKVGGKKLATKAVTSAEAAEITQFDSSTKGKVASIPKVFRDNNKLYDDALNDVKTTKEEKKAIRVQKKKARKALVGLLLKDTERGEKHKVKAADVAPNAELLTKVGADAVVDMVRPTTKVFAESSTATAAQICGEKDVDYSVSGITIVELGLGEDSVACTGDVPLSKVRLTKENDADLDE